MLIDALSMYTSPGFRYVRVLTFQCFYVFTETLIIRVKC